MSAKHPFSFETTKIMSRRSGPRTPITEADQLATICIARLPDKIKKAIQSYGSEDAFHTTLFVRVHFKNGHAVDFRHDWKEFVAQCILVYDLPERDDG
jgi:hypothetical protein